MHHQPARYLVAELAGEERACVVQLMLEYDPQPPFDAGHIRKASAAVREQAEREMKRLARSPREAVALTGALLRRWMHVLHHKVRGERSAL